MIRRICLLVLLALSAAPVARADEALGRLFFTPEKRAALDRERQLRVRQVERIEGAISLDGVVKRSSGRNTVWINSRPHDVAQSQQGISVTIGSDATDATLRVGEESPATLRVGEALDRDTGERHDGLRGGRLAPKPSRP